MTADVGIQSLDAVNAGDWLVCTRGPIQYKKDGKSFYPPEWEGVLVNVLAVSPPMLLARLFPFPGNGQGNRALEMAVHWDRQRFGRATPAYVAEYLKLAGFKPDGSRLRGEVKPLPPVPGDGFTRPKKRRAQTKTLDDILDKLREDEAKRNEDKEDDNE